jgi:hypothetical protein
MFSCLLYEVCSYDVIANKILEFNLELCDRLQKYIQKNNAKNFKHYLLS